MNERLRQRIENFAELGAKVNRPIRREPPFPASDKGMQLMPDIRRDGLIPPRQEGMQTLPDINRDGLAPDYSGAMQLIRDIEAMGGSVSEGEKRLYMSMSPEEIQQIRERENLNQMLNNASMDFTRGIVDDTKGTISDREMELFKRMSPSYINGRDNRFLEALIEGKGDAGTLSERERQYFERMSPSYDVDIDGRDYQFEGDGGLDLMGLRQRLGLEPMYDATGTKFDEVMVMPEAEALSQMGRGKDTLLGHLEAGDVVVPPDVLENDPILADILEERMAMAGVDPASRIAGVGIASLNPNTGLEEFGLFKSIKKVVKKVAPYAGIIAAPFTGGLSAALIGGAGGLLSGKGLKGAALGALGGFGANAALGKLGLTASAVKGAGGLMPALKGAGAKIAGGLKGLGSLSGKGGGLGAMLSGAGGQQGGQQGGGLGTGLGGGLGIGGLLAAGLPAAYLAKKAYDETKKDYGVPMTPMTQFDSMGRYNIEAEIARRMGKEQPNPVEFGLLPELPELSGGAPIERKAYGGPVMAFAEGGDVALEDFERMSGDINGAGTETSDDIPAMLSDGEFVMTGQSVRGAGAFDMTKGEGGIITLVPSLEEDRERGTDLMYQMMSEFSNYAKPI